MAASPRPTSGGVQPVEPLVASHDDRSSSPPSATPPDPHRPSRSRPTGRRILLWTVVVVAVLLVVARLAAPAIIGSVLNDRLEDLDGYTGEVGDVDLGVIAGVLALDDLQVRSTADGPGADETEVHSRCPRVVFDADWSTVFDESLLGTLRLVDPTVTLRPIASKEGQEGEESQAARRGAWRGDGALSLALPQALPVSCREIHVEGGELRLVTERSGHQVDLAIENLRLTVEGLEALGEGRGSDDPPSDRDPGQAAQNASARITGEAAGSGELAIDLRFATGGRRVDATVDARLEQLDLVAINDLLRAYGDFDVQDGRASIFAEFTIREGAYQGYVKILTWDLDIFSWRGDSGEGLGDAFYEALLGLGAEILENQPKDQQGVRIPLEGDLDDADMDLSAAVFSVLRNAFVRAMFPSFE